MVRSGVTDSQPILVKSVNPWLDGVEAGHWFPRLLGQPSVRWSAKTFFRLFCRLFAGATLIISFGCGGNTSGASPNGPTQQSSGSIVFTTKPTILREDGAQTALLAHFVTNVPVKASYRLEGAVAEDSTNWRNHSESFSRLHYQPIPISLGGGQSQRRLVISLQTESGATSQHELYLSSADVQLGSAPTLNWNPVLKLPPLTLLSLSRAVQSHESSPETSEVSGGENEGLLLAFDQTGELIWRYQHPDVIGQVLQRDPSSLMLVSASGVYVIDLLGTPMAWLGGQAQASTVKRPEEGVFVATRVPGIERLNQPMAVLPDGHTLVLSDLRGSNPELLELDQSGSVVWRRDLAESAVLGETSKTPADHSTSSLAYDPTNQVVAFTQGESASVIGIERNHSGVLWQYPKAASHQNTIHSLTYAFNGDLLVIDETPDTSDEPGEVRLSRLDIDGAQPARLVAQITLVDYATRNLYPSTASTAKASDPIAHLPRRMAKQILRPTPDGEVIWVRSVSGTSVTEVTNLQQGSQPVLNPVVALDDATASSWVIEDVLALNHDFSSADFAYAAARRRHAADADSNGAPKLENVSFYGLAIAPDLSVEGVDVSGDWELFIGDAALAEPQSLRLDQDESVVSGDFSGLPLTALIRGNTFSTTFRVGYGAEQTKFKYRGLVDSSESYMEGHVGLYRDGNLLDLTRWEARKR